MLKQASSGDTRSRLCLQIKLVSTVFGARDSKVQGNERGWEEVGGKRYNKNLDSTVEGFRRTVELWRMPWESFGGFHIKMCLQPTCPELKQKLFSGMTEH